MDQADQGSLQVLREHYWTDTIYFSTMSWSRYKVTLLNAQLAQLSSQVTQPPAASPTP